MASNVTCVLIVMTVMVGNGVVLAASRSTSESIMFDLPRQPLHVALQRYSSLTGRSVLYDAGEVAGRRSTPVHGVFSADEALRLLVRGSGMQAHFAASDAFILVPEEGRRAALRAPTGVSPHTHPRFYGLVQASVTRALCANPGLAMGSYRLALRFHVNAARAIEQVQVHATGHGELEAEIHRRLEGLPLGMRPPVALNRPIILLIEPGDGRGECVR